MSYTKCISQRYLYLSLPTLRHHSNSVLYYNFRVGESRNQQPSSRTAAVQSRGRAMPRDIKRRPPKNDNDFSTEVTSERAELVIINSSSLLRLYIITVSIITRWWIPICRSARSRRNKFRRCISKERVTMCINLDCVFFFLFKRRPLFANRIAKKFTKKKKKRDARSEERGVNKSCRFYPRLSHSANGLTCPFDLWS